MIALLLGLIGVVVGILTARRHKGNRLDMAQYAAGFGISFALAGLFASILFGWI